MTDQELEAIEARANAASEGPWYEEGWFTEDEDGDYVEIEPADAVFISHAREDIPALLDEIDRLTEQLSAYKGAGFTPERIAELVTDEKNGRVTTFPFIAMVEQSLQDGKMTPQRDQKFNGRYAVVYVDPHKWNYPLIDICGRAYNPDEAADRLAILSEAETSGPQKGEKRNNGN